MSGTQVIITFETKPDASIPFASMLTQVQQDLPRVPGCRGVRVFTGSENPCIFTLLEHWDSQAEHQAHIQTVVASGTWDRIAAHLAKDPVSHYYREQ
jgi:quinol monooxygenase YgiN